MLNEWNLSYEDWIIGDGEPHRAVGEVFKWFAGANIEYDRVSNGFPDWAAVSFTEQNGKRVRKRE